jgi:1,2-diacylglycerol 3-beta-galactosyltransferase
VVSLIPHFNRAIQEALEGVWPGVPYVTLLTDIADYPPHFWMEPDTPGRTQYVICGSERATSQAREIGIRPNRIFRTSGMVLNPAFYEPLNIDRNAERARLGLRPDVPTGLVLFGSEGSDEMLRIATALNRSESQVQLILLCGKNKKLAAKLRAMEQRIPMFIHGFTPEIPLFMEMADFFVGKPGPGSISEALAKRLPVIVQRNAWTLAHERYNADWVEEQGVGLVVQDFSAEVTGAVETLLAPDNYIRLCQRVENMRNEAVFEVPDFLQSIMPEKTRDDSPYRMPQGVPALSA